MKGSDLGIASLSLADKKEKAHKEENAGGEQAHVEKDQDTPRASVDSTTLPAMELSDDG